MSAPFIPDFNDFRFLQGETFAVLEKHNLQMAALNSFAAALVDYVEEKGEELLVAGGKVFPTLEAGMAVAEDDQYFYAESPDPAVSKTLYQRISSTEHRRIADEPVATEDVVRGYITAMSPGALVERRIGDANIDYTTSLADGGPENRPPLRYADRTVGASGITFRLTAPSLVARRAALSLSVNDGALIEVSILTGLPASEIANGNGLLRAGVAWFSAGRVRLTETPETIYIETADAVATTSFRASFTFGTAGSGADIEAPAAAVYAIPFFEFTGEGFDFFASELRVERVDQRRQLQRLERTGYRDLLSLLDEQTAADIFDFTNPVFMSSAPVAGQPFPLVKALVGDGYISGDVDAVRTDGRVLPGQSALTPGRRYFTASKPLLPETGDFTVFASALMDGEQTGNRTLFWQHSSGQPGRVQCVINGVYDGFVQATNNESVGIWVEGITEGAGVDGYPRGGNAQRGLPVSAVVVFRDGPGQSEYWLNGELIDTFTRPPVIYQGNTVLMGTGGSSNQSGRSYGRFGVIDRALSPDEIGVAGQWAADAYGDTWRRKVLGNSELLNATGAVSYLISAPSSPSKISDYSNMQPLFLHGHQQILYPASMTKVLTCMVMLDNIGDLQSTIEMQAGDETGGSGNNISPGDIITYEDAIYNMMLPSSNVTTTVVARVIGTLLLDGSSGDPVARFVEEMNAKAKKLGMLSSNFTNPSGLAETEMVTTGEDMGRLCASVVSYPELLSRWGALTRTITITGPDPRTVEVTHSAHDFFVEQDGNVIGGKTGSVSSSPLGNTTRNLMIVSKMPGGNYVATVIMVTNSSGANRYTGMTDMLNYVRTNMRWPLASMAS